MVNPPVLIFALYSCSLNKSLFAARKYENQTQHRSPTNLGDNTNRVTLYSHHLERFGNDKPEMFQILDQRIVKPVDQLEALIPHIRKKRETQITRQLLPHRLYTQYQVRAYTNTIISTKHNINSEMKTKNNTNKKWLNTTNQHITACKNINELTFTPLVRWRAYALWSLVPEGVQTKNISHTPHRSFR